MGLDTESGGRFMSRKGRAVHFVEKHQGVPMDFWYVDRETGREFDWMIAAFSPRKQNMTLYVICDSPKQPELLAKLGKYTTSVACLYIKRLSDVDEKVLEAIVKDSYKHAKKSMRSV